MFNFIFLGKHIDMIKTKLITILDKIFLSCTVFLIVYAWINFFVSNLMTTFILSLIFSGSIIFVFHYFFNRKKAKKISIANYLKDVEEKFLAFSLLGVKKRLELIYQIASQDYKCEKHKDKIVCFDQTKKIVILTNFNSERLTQFELNKTISGMFKYDEIKIICKEKNPTLNLKVFKNTNIEIVSKKELYDEWFLKHSIFPETCFLNTEKNKINLKKILRNFIVKSKSKSYLFCGFILLFSSIILPYHLYYLIFGSLLIIMSILCRFEHLIFR